MTLEDWKRLIGKPLPRWRAKESRWEIRRTIKDSKGKSSRVSDYADTLEQLAKKLGHVFERPSVTIPSWESKSLGNWVATEFLPLYDEERRAQSTRNSAVLFSGKLLDYKHEGKYLADLPPSALTIAVLVRAFADATRGNKGNTKRATAAIWIRILTLLSESDLVPTSLPKRFRREIDLPAYTRSEKCPTVEEVMQVVIANKGKPVAAVLYAALTLGADFTEASMMPRSGLLKGIAVLKGTKNDYRDREIPLPDDLKRDLLAMCGPKVLGELKNGKALEFNANRRLYDAFVAAGLCRPAVTKNVKGKRIREQPDPNPWHFKSVRHTFTGIEHKLGCPSSVRVRIMGHSPNSIAQAYQHPDDDTVKDWLDRWHRHVTACARGLEKGSEPTRKSSGSSDSI